MKLCCPLLLLLVVISVEGQKTADNCCALCATTAGVKGIDVTDWKKCSAEKSVCCFEKQCKQSTFTQPTLNNVEYKKDLPTIKKGEFISFKWNNVEEVKYILLQKGRSKTSQVLNSSQAAKVKDGFFFLCAESVGTLYFRGFKDGGCAGSAENSVVIEDGDKTCSNSKPPTLTSPTAAEGECSASRGSLKGGKCVCSDGWAGPPDCSSWPWWKWLVSIAGGVAGLVSIIFTLKTYLNRKKAAATEAESMSPGKTDTEHTYMAQKATEPVPSTDVSKAIATEYSRSDRISRDSREFTL